MGGTGLQRARRGHVWDWWGAQTNPCEPKSALAAVLIELACKLGADKTQGPAAQDAHRHFVPYAALISWYRTSEGLIHTFNLN